MLRKELKQTLPWAMHNRCIYSLYHVSTSTLKFNSTQEGAPLASSGDFIVFKEAIFFKRLQRQNSLTRGGWPGSLSRLCCFPPCPKQAASAHTCSKERWTTPGRFCMSSACFCWRGWESAPNAVLLKTSIDQVLLFQFPSPGIGFKNWFLHFMSAKATEAEDVSFKFKDWLQGEQTAPAIQPPLQLCSLETALHCGYWYHSHTNTCYLCYGEADWFLTFTEGLSACI